MKLRVNPVLVLELIEERVTHAAICGWRRAHKYTDTPTDEQIFDAVSAEIGTVLSAWFPTPGCP